MPTSNINSGQISSSSDITSPKIHDIDSPEMDAAMSISLYLEPKALLNSGMGGAQAGFKRAKEAGLDQVELYDLVESMSPQRIPTLEEILAYQAPAVLPRRPVA